MDLGAYAQIEDLDSIAKANGISCPRLRGYRLMRDERPIDYKVIVHDIELEVLIDLCQSQWGTTWWITSSCETDARCRYHIKNFDWYYKLKDTPGYKEPEIRWERLKGKKKRIFRTRVKNALRRYKKQYDVWNKYAGRPDVLYIHSRIGGGNWPYYYADVVYQPWFLEKVDDACDSTYCDIYAKIEPFEGKIAEEE